MWLSRRGFGDRWRGWAMWEVWVWGGDNGRGPCWGRGWGREHFVGGSSGGGLEEAERGRRVAWGRRGPGGGTEVAQEPFTGQHLHSSLGRQALPSQPLHLRGDGDPAALRSIARPSTTTSSGSRCVIHPGTRRLVDLPHGEPTLSHHSSFASFPARPPTHWLCYFQSIA